MLTLLRQARLRLLLNEALSQGANAFSAALVAFTLLLVLGTQILDWRWCATIPLAAAGFGLYRLWKAAPSPYAVAQLLDRRAVLRDSLSTACFFSATAAAGNQEIRDYQYRQAEQAAQTVDLRKALPLTVPRAAYVLAVLALVATSLFAIRYGFERRLNLRTPLARILQQSFGPVALQPPEALLADKNAREEAGAQDEAASPLAGGKRQDAIRATPEMTSAQGRQPDAANRQPGASESASKEQIDQDPSEDGQGRDGESRQSESDSRAGGREKSQSGADRTQQSQQASANRQTDNSGEGSGALGKFRDALKNLIERMKPQASGQQQQSAGPKGGQRQASQQGAGRQSQPSQQQTNGGQGADSQRGQQAGQSQAGLPSASAENGGDSSKKEQVGGIGTQDGNKDAKLAEQLAAMGEISQIIGKRSANVTGEATVEVRSTSQQLSTPYAKRSARHAESGAEIDRDEIPVGLEAYVTEYFERVRKQPAQTRK